jgi:hypothetical protein
MAGKADARASLRELRKTLRDNNRPAYEWSVFSLYQ